MKIKTAEWLGAKFSGGTSMLRLRTFNLMADAANYPKDSRIFSPDELTLRKEIVERLCTHGRQWTHYLFTEKARRLAAGIEIDRARFNYPMLATIKEGNYCYMPEPNIFLRWFRGERGLIVFYMKANHDSETVTRHTFHIDAEEGVSALSDKNWPEAELLLKYIVFTELTNPEFLFVEAGKESTNRKAPLGQRITNQTEIPIIRVHAHWNTVVINTSIIRVRGFMRQQPCGPGRRDRKEIFIDSHTRNGYTRNAKMSA